MSDTITARFDTTGKVENAVDDLLATGIPDDNIRADRDQRRVSVVMPETAAPEIEEILKRHQPLEITH